MKKITITLLLLLIAQMGFAQEENQEQSGWLGTGTLSLLSPARA